MRLVMTRCNSRILGLHLNQRVMRCEGLSNVSCVTDLVAGTRWSISVFGLFAVMESQNTTRSIVAYPEPAILRRIVYVQLGVWSESNRMPRRSLRPKPPGTADESSKPDLASKIGRANVETWLELSKKTI